MAEVRYILVERRDFSKGAPEGAKKFFAQISNNGIISFDELCASIAEESALTSADVKGVLDRAFRLLAANIGAGRTVQMGDLGSFRPAISSAGAPTAEAFDATVMMRPMRLTYLPSRALKKAVNQKVQYVRVKKTDKPGGGEEEPDIPGGI